MQVRLSKPLHESWFIQSVTTPVSDVGIIFNARFMRQRLWYFVCLSVTNLLAAEQVYTTN